MEYWRGRQRSEQPCEQQDRLRDPCHEEPAVHDKVLSRASCAVSSAKGPAALSALLCFGGSPPASVTRPRAVTRHSPADLCSRASPEDGPSFAAAPATVALGFPRCTAAASLLRAPAVLTVPAARAPPAGAASPPAGGAATHGSSAAPRCGACRRLARLPQRCLAADVVLRAAPCGGAPEPDLWSGAQAPGRRRGRRPHRSANRLRACGLAESAARGSGHAQPGSARRGRPPREPDAARRVALRHVPPRLTGALEHVS